jgi:peptide chain release factor
MNTTRPSTALLLSCTVETFRSGGKGGQHQNKTESGVRLRHIETGISVVCRDERSQHLNKFRALEILEKRLAKLREKPKIRIATKASKGAKRRTLEKKHRTGQIKQARRKFVIDD